MTTKVALSEVCEITDGTHYTPPNSGGPYPFLTVVDMRDGELAFRTCSRISRQEFERARANGCSPAPGDVLFSKDGTVGKVHVVTTEPDFAVLSSIAILRPDPSKITSKYLSFALRSDTILADAENRKTGSALQRIILADLKRVRIPLPSLDAQVGIADSLDKVDRLCRTRRYALQLSDEFLPAVFLEMFGDPRTNPKKIQTILLGEALRLRSGEFLPASAMAPDGRYPVYGGNGIAGKHSKALFTGRQIVIGRVGVYCGVVHYTEPDPWITDNALYIADRSVEFDDEFLVELLRQLDLNRFSDQAGQPLISQGRLEKVALLLPPMAEQRKFGNLVTKHQRYGSTHAEALRQADHLFQTLLHDAFAS